MYNYTRNDFAILQVLLSHTSNEYDSLSINEIKAKSGLSTVKIRNTLLKFIADDFARYGIKDGSANCYYISDVGKEKMKELINT